MLFVHDGQPDLSPWKDHDCRFEIICKHVKLEKVISKCGLTEGPLLLDNLISFLQ